MSYIQNPQGPAKVPQMVACGTFGPLSENVKVTQLCMVAQRLRRPAHLLHLGTRIANAAKVSVANMGRAFEVTP